LKSLKITQRDLAQAFEMRDSNLYKYLIGERKLNTDIVLKLSSFSHTQPELWYYIQTKNELADLFKEKEKINKYKKYEYENFVFIN
jgi:antitoxin HigA-1